MTKKTKEKKEKVLKLDGGTLCKELNALLVKHKIQSMSLDSGRVIFSTHEWKEDGSCACQFSYGFTPLKMFRYAPIPNWKDSK